MIICVRRQMILGNLMWTDMLKAGGPPLRPALRSMYIGTTSMALPPSLAAVPMATLQSSLVSRVISSIPRISGKLAYFFLLHIA